MAGFKVGTSIFIIIYFTLNHHQNCHSEKKIILEQKVPLKCLPALLMISQTAAGVAGTMDL